MDDCFPKVYHVLYSTMYLWQMVPDYTDKQANLKNRNSYACYLGVPTSPGISHQKRQKAHSTHLLFMFLWVATPQDKKSLWLGTRNRAAQDFHREITFKLTGCTTIL